MHLINCDASYTLLVDAKAEDLPIVFINSEKNHPLYSMDVITAWCFQQIVKVVFMSHNRCKTYHLL